MSIKNEHDFWGTKQGFLHIMMKRFTNVSVKEIIKCVQIIHHWNISNMLHVANR